MAGGGGGGEGGRGKGRGGHGTKASRIHAIVVTFVIFQLPCRYVIVFFLFFYSYQTKNKFTLVSYPWLDQEIL